MTQFVSTDETKEEDKKTKVNHFYFNMWAMLFQSRLKQIKEGKKNLKFTMGELEFSTIILNICMNYPYDIEKFTFLRKIADYMFVKTRRFYTFMFLLFFFNFILFLAQITMVTGGMVRVLLVIQGVIQVFFFISELIQIADRKLDYLRSIYNLTDLAHFIIFCFYTKIRWNDTESTIPQAEFIGKVRTFDEQTQLTVLNLAIIITGTIKIMYFIRVYKAIGWIVELVERCLFDVKEFTFFFIGIMGLFGTMFIIAGVYPFDDTDAEAYFLFWITVFRNCIGDIQDLEYPFWQGMLTKNVTSAAGDIEQQFQTGPVLMVFFIFTIFAVLLFLMIIVLLNFLIAVISQTYENVMTTRTSTTYLHYAELNRECRLNLHSFGMDQQMNPFILSCECSSEMMAGEWEGFINTIKSVVNFETRNNKKRIDILRRQMREDFSYQLDYRVGRMKWEIKYELRDLQKVAMAKKK